MPTITIGNTTKKLNSTSQSFSGTQLSCKLKNPTSLHDPVFEVQGLTDGSFYNYASYGSRYYWVDDVIQITNAISEVHCHLDPLATFKSAITGTSALVIYGDSTNWSKLIDDTRLQPEMRYATQTIGNANMFGLTPNNTGCVAMTFTSTTSVDWMTQASSLAGTGVHTALMSVEEMRKCIGDLTGFDPGQGITGSGLLEMLEAFGRVIQSLGGGSIADYIQRIIWLPFKLSDIVSATGATYRLGMFIGGVLADQCNWYDVNPGNIYSHDGNFTIDWSTLTSGNDFLKNERWISMQVYTPGGYQEIPAYCFKYANTLYYRTTFSITDGSWNMRLSADSNMHETLTTFSGNISVDLLGTVNLGNDFTGQIADMGASFVGGAVGMGVGNLAGISGALPQTNFNCRSASGSFSGASSIFLTSTPAAMIVYATCYIPYMLNDYASYCSRYGYPCNKYLTLSSVSGYCQCAGASVNGASGATEGDLQTINSYLNSGFYIE